MTYISPLIHCSVGKDDGKSPVGIFLHGFRGSPRRHPLIQSNLLQVIPYWIIPQAPIVMPHNNDREGYAWFPKDDTQMQGFLDGTFNQNYPYLDLDDIPELGQLLYNLLLANNVLQRKFVIAGFSQGGMMAGELTVLLSKKARDEKNINILPSAVILLSTAMIAQKRWTNSLSSLPQVPPVLVCHGNDDNLFPPHIGKTVYMFWKQYSSQAQYYMYKDGHIVTEAVTKKVTDFCKKIV